MRDVQSETDRRNIPLDEAGISGLSYPVTILDRENREQRTVADFTMSVSLPDHFRGTHMSRFVEVLEESGCRFEGETMPRILKMLLEALNSLEAMVTVSFPYFITREAPVTGASAKMRYECRFTGRYGAEGYDFMLSVTVPVGTLCPCSREISGSGAHNQRGYVTIEARTERLPDGSFAMLWIEELVDIAEEAASSPLYTILKRPDEKYVTERAYQRPVFAEDIVRNVAETLMKDSRITEFTVRAENHESIHRHNAYAVVRWMRN